MSASFPVARPRRLRRTPALRALVAETSLRPRELVLPVFIKEGISEPQPIGSMPGVVQHTRDSLRKAAAEAAGAGVGGLIVFGVPAVKDGRGSAADDPAGISQLALADLRAEVGDDCVVLADLCMCEYTDHGHCGLLTEDGDVSNDATLERYAAIAVAQAEAGAHLVAPSGMMDGQVAAIRAALDAAGHGDVGICAYSAKYASGFYGPFREAAEGAPAFGDRASHQQDPANAAEALREVALDIAEGADMVMVKPALAYLDVIRRVADTVTVPVAAYQVSGEFAMVEAAAANGWLERDRIIIETLTAIRRAGASVILTYWAAEVRRAAEVTARVMDRTACGLCPTIGNRELRAVIPGLVRYLRYLARKDKRSFGTVPHSRAAANGRSGRNLWSTRYGAAGYAAGVRNGTSRPATWRHNTRPWAGRCASAPMPTAARSPRWNRAARAPATGWDAPRRARTPCRRPGRCRRP